MRISSCKRFQASSSTTLKRQLSLQSREFLSPAIQAADAARAKRTWLAWAAIVEPLQTREASAAVKLASVPKRPDSAPWSVK
jgi:hypothetical protein